MPVMRSSRFLTFAGLVIIFCAVVGGFSGRSALVAQDQVPDQYKVFTAALGAIEDNYVGESNRTGWSTAPSAACCRRSTRIRASWIPAAYAQMRERQEGRYYGLGITINVVDGDITVVNVFEGSPAYQKGLRRGDVIAKIEGEDTKGWTSEQAVSQAARTRRARPSTSSIRRAGYDKLIDLAVMRDEIHIPTVPAAFMLDATTGYIKLHDFGENTDQELGRALEDLTKQGMKRLRVRPARQSRAARSTRRSRSSNRFLPQAAT